MIRTREQIEAELERGIQEMKPMVDSINKELDILSDEEQSEAINKMFEKGEKLRRKMTDEMKEQYQHGYLLINSFDSHDMTLDAFLRKEGVIE